MEDLSYLPVSLSPGDSPPGNMREYAPLVELLYTLTEFEENAANNTFTIKINFFQHTADELTQIVEAHDIIEALMPSSDLAGLHRLIQYVISPGFRMTQNNHEAISASMNHQDLNTKIRTYATQLDNQVAPATTLLDCFCIVMKYIGKAVSHWLKKIILASELYQSLFQWTSQIASLDAEVTEMLLSLGSRTQINARALELVRMRTESCRKYTEYMQHFDEGHFAALRIHLVGLDLHKVTFKWADLKNGFRDRTIWYSHSCPGPTQLEHVLQDQDLAQLSKNLDSNVEKIRAYVPSADLSNITKKERLGQRYAQIKTDMENFNKSSQKNVSKARLMVDTLKFLNQQLEKLHMEGVEYTEQSVGVDPSDVADRIDSLETYISKVEAEKRQRELTSKLNSVEYSKLMPGLSLVKLHGPQQYLNWMVSFNNMNKIVQNNVTKLSLIKASLQNHTDKKFLESSTSVEDCLTYLKNKYSSRDEILYVELAKLYKMKRVGSNLKLMVANSEKFILTTNLFDMHGLIGKLNQVVRNRIIDKIMTESQMLTYECELIKREQAWRSSLTVEPDVEVVEEINLTVPKSPTSAGNAETRNVTFSPRQQAGAATPFATPLHSPTVSTNTDPMVEAVPPRSTLETKYTSETVETIIEKRKREYFLRFHKRMYEACRRTLHNSTMFDEKYHEGRRNNRYNRYNDNYSYKVDEKNDPCGLCKKPHKPTLQWCSEFRRMSVEERHKTIFSLFKDLCKICLALNRKDEAHKGGVCSIQQDKKLKCKECGSEKHNTMLHKTFNPSSNRNRGGSGNRGRGRGGRGGGSRRGRQYKRQSRKSRISSSEKAMMTTAEDCTCDDNECNALDIQAQGTVEYHNLDWAAVDEESLVDAQCHKTVTIKHDSKDLKRKCKVHPQKTNVAKDKANTACKKHQALKKHIDSGHPDTGEYYFPSVSQCKFSGADGASVYSITMWDTGSSLSFATAELCKRLQLEEIGHFKGDISTLAGKAKGPFPIYLLKAKGIDKKDYGIPVIAMDYVGFKQQIPAHVYKYICKIAEVDEKHMDTCYGYYGVLIGATGSRLFPPAVNVPGQKKLEQQLPDLIIYQCKLSGKLFVYGNYRIGKMPWEKNESKMVNAHQVAECHGIFSESKSARSSFRNRKGLRLSIFNSEDEARGYEELVNKDRSGSMETLHPASVNSPLKLSPFLSPPLTIKKEPFCFKNLNEDIEKSRLFWETQSIKSRKEKEKGLEKEPYYNTPKLSRAAAGKTKLEVIDLMETFNVQNFHMNEHHCTVILTCSHKCELHKKVDDFKKFLHGHRTAESAYEPMNLWASAYPISATGKMIVKAE